MPNRGGNFVKLLVDKVERAAFRAARDRDGVSLKELATIAGIRESLLMRYEYGQKFIHVDELEGFNEAFRLLNLPAPKVSEPFYYSGNGVLPGTKRDAPVKRKKLPKPVMTAPKPAPPAPAPAPEAPKLPFPEQFLKPFMDVVNLLDLERRGILTGAAAKDAIYYALRGQR